jgi:hypothetical protein
LPEYCKYDHLDICNINERIMKNKYYALYYRILILILGKLCDLYCKYDHLDLCNVRELAIAGDLNECKIVEHDSYSDI